MSILLAWSCADYAKVRKSVLSDLRVLPFAFMTVILFIFPGHARRRL
jgi:hypothetical protein